MTKSLSCLDQASSPLMRHTAKVDYFDQDFFALICDQSLVLSGRKTNVAMRFHPISLKESQHRNQVGMITERKYLNKVHTMTAHRAFVTAIP